MTANTEKKLFEINSLNLAIEIALECEGLNRRCPAHFLLEFFCPRLSALIGGPAINDTLQRANERLNSNDSKIDKSLHLDGWGLILLTSVGND